MADAASRRRDATGRPFDGLRRRARPRSRLRDLRLWWRRRYPRAVPAWTGQTAGESPGSGTVLSRHDDGLEVKADSVGSLHALLIGPPGDDGLDSGRGLRLTVADWEPPVPGWSGRLADLPGLVYQEVSLPERGRGRVTVTVRLAGPVPLRTIVQAVLPLLEPRRPLPSPLSPDPTADARGAVPAGDLIVVDALTANPRGRHAYGSDLATGQLGVVAGPGGLWWRIGTPETEIVVAGRAGDPLDIRQTEALLRLRAVVARETAPGIAPAALAAAVAQLAMTGVVVHAPALGEATAGLLATDLVALARQPLPDRDADETVWEGRSIAQRRSALRNHGAAFALPAARANRFPILARAPLVTALLVSKRPEQVAAAAAALAAQTYPELELVVGLHGGDLPAGDLDRIIGCGRPVQLVRIPGDVTFGEALGEATRFARGSLITKIDDDDRYGREHVWDLVLARHYSGATAVGKGAEFVYLQPRGVSVRRRMRGEMYADVVAGGTILVARGDLEAVGGWRPLASAVDLGLLERIRRGGGLIYRTHGFGFVYTRHGDGHTWDPGLEYFLRDPRRTWTGLPPYDETGPP